MERVRRSPGRRALFALTDPRSLYTLVIGLAALFVSSLTMGYRTTVVYPWNAPRPEPPPASVAASEDEAEPPESVTEVVIAPEEASTAVDEGASDANVASRPEGGARTVEPEARPRVEPPTSTPSAGRASRPATTTNADRDPPPAEEPTPDPPAVDLSPITGRIGDLESAISDERTGTATQILADVERMASGLRAPELSPGGALRQRITVARERVALLEFEDAILSAVQGARSAQETGDYPTAIGALNALVARAESAPAGLAARMMDRLDFYRVEATAGNLLEACQFERANLGRTAPCTNR